MLLWKGQAPNPPADPAPANGGLRIEELRIAAYARALNTVRTVFARCSSLEEREKFAPPFTQETAFEENHLGDQLRQARKVVRQSRALSTATSRETLLLKGTTSSTNVPGFVLIKRSSPPNSLAR